MNTIENIRFWLLREPYQNLNFFALLIANGMMECANDSPATAQGPLRRMADWIASRARNLSSPHFGFLEFLACNSTVATFAPARWNALVASMNNGGDYSYGGVNDNNRTASLGPTEEAA